MRDGTEDFVGGNGHDGVRRERIEEGTGGHWGETALKDCLVKVQG